MFNRVKEAVLERWPKSKVIATVARERHQADFGTPHNGKFEVWLEDKHRAKYCVHTTQFGDKMIEPIDIDGLIDKIDYNIDKFIKISDSEMELMEKQVDIPWHRFEDESY